MLRKKWLVGLAAALTLLVTLGLFAYYRVPPYHRSHDVVYGRKAGLALTMEVFTPENESNGLAVIAVASSGFVSGPEMVQPLCYHEFLRRGYTVFAVMHGSQPLFTIPEIIDDIQRAVRFVRYNARSYGIDPRRIGILGASSGGHLSLMHVHSTREDKLPYMRPFLRALDQSPLDDLCNAPTDPAWQGRDTLVRVLLGRDQVAGVGAALAALHAGAGIRGLLDAVAIAASERMLRHDFVHEQHPDVTGYNWLDITHSLTYANAARWAWTADPGSHTARLAMYTVFHVVDGGRHATVDSRGGASVQRSSLTDALAAADPDDAVAGAFTEPLEAVRDALVKASLDDRAGALIVVAHHIKTVRAAIREAEVTGSRLPLAAAARFISAPGRQRFVSSSVMRARHFLSTGTPPPR